MLITQLNAVVGNNKPAYGYTKAGYSVISETNVIPIAKTIAAISSGGTWKLTRFFNQDVCPDYVVATNYLYLPAIQN